MVRLWAEKEMRNLKRFVFILISVIDIFMRLFNLALILFHNVIYMFSLETAGIKCPRTLLLKNHVLLMTFIGHNGWYCVVNYMRVFCNV